eukprot:481712-Pyramimonas_sp.AAC.1
MLFLAVVPSSQAHAQESACIAYSRPAADNLSNPHSGRLRARYRETPRRRRHRTSRRQALPRCEAQTVLSQSWYDRRMASLCTRYMGFSRYLAGRYRWQHFLQHKYGDLYDRLLQQWTLQGLGYGPLNISGTGLTVLMMKWISVQPHAIPWEYICRGRQHGSDF